MALTTEEHRLWKQAFLEELVEVTLHYGRYLDAATMRLIFEDGVKYYQKQELKDGLP